MEATISGKHADYPRTETRRTFVVVIGALIALKIAALFVIAWNRRFVMDEMQQLGWAKYIPDQIGQLAIHHPKSSGYALFFDLAHLIGRNAHSILLAGRMEMALLACGTLAIVYALARSIGQTRMRSALAVLVLLCFSNFIERIIETRADPLATFFGAAALLAAVRSEGRRSGIVGAGVLSGLAFLSTQKALYFDVALGLALIREPLVARRWTKGIAAGAWLVLGWLVPVVVYCLALGGSQPLAVAQNLFFGPLAAAAPQRAGEYGGLRQFLVQTLVRNALLYLLCFAGMVLTLLRMRRLSAREKMALTFSVIVTLLVFMNDQSWPYVFVMALPFVALWGPGVFDAVAGNRLRTGVAWAVLGIAVATSFARNVQALRIDNHAQLALVSRAEKMLGPDDVYFDGVGMLPNRREPSTYWLDRHAILETTREGKSSEPWRIFASAPPKAILWSYRMDAIEPLVGPLIRDSYVQVAPNIRLAGVELRPGETVTFDVPVAGRYAVYDLLGLPVMARLAVDGVEAPLPLELGRGRVTVTLLSGPGEALLVPQGRYAGLFALGRDDPDLFANVYG